MSGEVAWSGPNNLRTQRYVCGYCGADVGADKGWFGTYAGDASGASVAICPNCTYPTFLRSGEDRVPGAKYGNDVQGVDDASVATLYEEARRCTAAGAPTAGVLACRKLLMHIAVAKGAPEGENFASYVDYLASKGYVPPDGREWVDHIRQQGNQANHEIVIATGAGAEELIGFLEMLLKFFFSSTSFRHESERAQPRRLLAMRPPNSSLEPTERLRFARRPAAQRQAR